MSNQMNQFKIDVPATFAALVFSQCQPKKAFGSEQQEFTKGDNPLPKWDVELLGSAYDGRGGTSTQVLKIGMTSRTNPCEGLAQFEPVFPAGLTVGVMTKTKRLDNGGELITGTTVWMRAEEIQKIGATARSAA